MKRDQYSSYNLFFKAYKSRQKQFGATVMTHLRYMKSQISVKTEGPCLMRLLGLEKVALAKYLANAIFG